MAGVGPAGQDADCSLCWFLAMEVTESLQRVPSARALSA